MIVIAKHEYRHMPWKNGGGSTTEIAISPVGASLDSFDWRISMATVAEPGPFSAFPSIDRTLSILKGEGIRLDIEGAPVTLTRQSPPLSFPADINVFGTPLDGPITDLNVMTRRGRFSHTVTHMSGAAQLTLECRGSVSLILTVKPCQAKDGVESEYLPAGATALIQNAAGINLELTAQDEIEIYLIDLFQN